MTDFIDPEALNPDPMAEHDEWEQTIKDDKTLIPVNERYRIRQAPNFRPTLWCGTCNAAVEHEPTRLLSVFLAAAKEHEQEVHS